MLNPLNVRQFIKETEFHEDSIPFSFSTGAFLNHSIHVIQVSICLILVNKGTPRGHQYSCLIIMVWGGYVLGTHDSQMG